MPKLHLLFSAIHSQLTAAIFFAAFLVFTESCRKMDRVLNKNPALSETEAKFFSNHRSADAKESALVDFFQRRNDSSHFVETAVQRIGYPLWNKAITGKEVKPYGRSGDEDAYITYIPFARENENHVNASLVVRTAPGDTSFHYLCDWQYFSYGFDTTAAGWNAQTVFALFTTLDQSAFGHTRFRITDSRLFGGDSVTATLIPSLPGDAAELVTPVTECIFYEMVTCIEYTGGNAVEVMFNPCYTWYRSFCTTRWVYEPDPTGGGGGGNPSGDGPPPCEGINPSLAGKQYDPCGPGWEVIPLDDPPLLQEPVDSMLNRYARKIKHLADSTMQVSLSSTGKSEYGFLIVQNALGEIYAKRPIQTNGNTQTLTLDRTVIEPGEKIIAVYHTHPDAQGNKPLNRSAPSGSDFSDLKTFSVYRNTVFVDCGNVMYALVIEDVAKSRNFLYEYRPADLYIMIKAYAEANPIWMSNWQQASETALIELVPYNTSGIGIYKSDAEKTTFTKIN